jgi:hypothetical protein
MPGRVISDNILLSYELTHYLQNKRTGGSGFAALKLDMSKAYKRVEWSFLQGMLLKLGFKRKWVDLIMKCVSTVKYQVKVNNEVTETITPQRGLRQGIHYLPIFSSFVPKDSRPCSMKQKKRAS